MTEPDIIVHHREQLAELVTEAVEVEHNLMCCYLYAAWSLKSGVAEGLEEDQARAVASWRETIVHVAIDEMTHFANANNLLAAIGGRPHLGRPNFPVSAGYHPAGVVVELHPFDRATIDHFVYLERPEGVQLHDGEGYAAPSPYLRAGQRDLLLPTAQDYATVGHLYRGIRNGLESLAAELGERALFVGDPAAQVGPAIVQLDGLTAVVDLASAVAAVDAIVEQGEGNADNPERSHYRRFCTVRDELAARLAADPTFEPARPVVTNPVQRRPPTAGNKHWISAPHAAEVLDLGNALYNHMLRLVGTTYEAIAAGARAGLIDEAIGLMQMLGPINEVLTRLPADPSASGATAGMSFAVTRVVRVPPAGAAIAVLAERTRVLANGALRLRPLGEAFGPVGERLHAMAERIAALPR